MIGEVPGSRFQVPMECVVYSRHFRLAIEGYELMPNELRLAYRLCLETFDAGIIVGRVDLRNWAARLRMRDAKGVRVDKCEKVFKGLCDLGIVDLNAAQGSFQLRPDPSSWSRVRALYVSGPVNELGLCAERPLSESLSELSREKALKSVSEPTARDWHALFTEMNAAVQAGPEAVAEFERRHPGLFSAEKSAESASFAESDRRKNPPTQNLQSSQGFAASRAVSAEKSAEAPKLIAKAEAFCTRKALAEASPGGRPMSADKSAEAKQAWEWLQSEDAVGSLGHPVYAAQWQALCESRPDYVLVGLREKLVQMRAKGTRIENPIAYLARKAREEGRMSR